MRDATVQTTHADRAAAETIAAAVRPDNTSDVRTETDGAVVHTRITRETTGGLQSSADDYVVNVRVADRVIAHVRDGDAADDTVGDETADDGDDATTGDVTDATVTDDRPTDDATDDDT